MSSSLSLRNLCRSAGESETLIFIAIGERVKGSSNVFDDDDKDDEEDEDEDNVCCELEELDPDSDSKNDFKHRSVNAETTWCTARIP